MRKLILAACFITLTLFASSSFATVILTSDLTLFQNSGITTVVSDFEEFNSSGFDFPSDPFLQGGISYSSQDNLIINEGTQYTTNGTNMLVNNYWNPVEGTFYENFSLFGFDAGWSYVDDGGTTITIVTNLDTYSFYIDLDVASSSDFYGFIASDNEFFTSFLISSSTSSALVAIDNVTVGTLGVAPAPVPEPATALLFGIGMAGLVGVRIRKKDLR